MQRDAFRWHVQQMRLLVAHAATDGRVWSTFANLAAEAEAQAAADNVPDDEGDISP